VISQRLGAKCALEIAHVGEKLDAPNFDKYLRGYIKIRARGFSAGPNDASTRQKLAFPS
jgi:hypothetical protein